jgi:hypothetical protein
MGTAPAEEPLAALLFERFDFVLRTTRLQIPLRRLTNFASIFSPIFEAEKAEGGPFQSKSDFRPSKLSFPEPALSNSTDSDGSQDPSKVALHAERRRRRLLYSLHDLQQALSACEFLRECDDTQKYSRAELRRFRCYETALVIAYTRPFTQSRGEALPLSMKMTNLKLSVDRRALHDRLVEMRNKIVAHSDSEMMRMTIQPFVTRTPTRESDNEIWLSPIEHDGFEWARRRGGATLDDFGYGMIAMDFAEVQGERGGVVVLTTSARRIGPSFTALA